MSPWSEGEIEKKRHRDIGSKLAESAKITGQRLQVDTRAAEKTEEKVDGAEGHRTGMALTMNFPS